LKDSFNNVLMKNKRSSIGLLCASVFHAA
jgi:hypothetical protein